jgi:hypothetical protein
MLTRLLRAALPLIATALLLFVGCAGPATHSLEPQVSETAMPVSRESRLLAGVSEERCGRTVHDLVDFGPRMGGTQSGDAATEYRRAAFAAAGLEVEVREDSERWCHEELEWSCALEWLDADGAARRVELESAWPFGFSPSAEGRAKLSLEPSAGGAWIGRGSRRVDSGLAVALVDGASTEDGRYTQVSHLRSGPDNPVPVFGLGRVDGDLARGLLEEGLELWVDFRLVARIERAAPKTTLARLAAASGAGPGYFLFCAHGDSDAGGPGADDNASGEAVVLEIARAWAAAVAEDPSLRPAREVRFAIWGSEIHSTRDYLEAEVAGGGQLLGVVNFDQAGFGSGADQLNVEPDDLPANAPLVALAAAVLGEYAGSPGFPVEWATNKSLGGTDSYVFSSSSHFRENSLPSVTLFTSAWDSPEEHPRTPGMPGESWSERDLVRVDYDAYYHSSGDTPENTTDLEPWNMGWCARVGLLTVDRWLASLR